MQEMWIWSLDCEDPLEEGMATHSSTLAWRIPWTYRAWQAIIYRVAKSWTQLKRLSTWGFPSDGKDSACNAGDPGLIPGSGRFPWRREWPHTPVFLLGEFHGQRILEGPSPWGHNELDRTEQLTYMDGMKEDSSGTANIKGTTDWNCLHFEQAWW